MRFVILVFTLCAFAAAEVKRYDGYKVFTVTPENDIQAQMVAHLQENENFDFWSDARKAGHPTTIMVSPEGQKQFLATVESNKIPFTVLIEDVEKAYENQPKSVPGTKNLETEFLQYEAIQEYLDGLATNYPDIVTVDSIGKSYEGRDISIIRISSGVSANPKPVILIDGGIHAREWIAPSVVLYIIEQLVENPGNSELIENIDWHIIPVLNPDGYEYTFTTERFWRKTRSIGSYSIGVDANRNFDFHWMENGASSNERAETYAGPEPFSEPETQALRDYVEEYKSSIKLYLTFHSYGQYMIFPWGYTSDLPPNFVELYNVGLAAANAIEAVRGHTYAVGTSTNVLYAAAGGSDDWVKGVGEVELAYTIELPGGGNQGFNPSATQIRPIVQETFEAIFIFHSYITQKFVDRK